MKLLPILGSTYSGSIRGVTAATNRGGLYFRGRTIPTNTPSALRSLLRSAVAVATGEWSNVLDDIGRDAWNTYADSVSWTDKLGQSIRLSGQNMFVRGRSQALYAASNFGTFTAPVVTDVPLEPLLGTPPAITAASLVLTAGPPATADLALTVSNSADYPANTSVLVYLTGAKPDGRRAPTTPTNIAIADDVAASVTGDLLVSPWASRYGAPLAGQTFWGYARTLYADNRLSGKAEFQVTVPT